MASTKCNHVYPSNREVKGDLNTHRKCSEKVMWRWSRDLKMLTLFLCFFKKGNLKILLFFNFYWSIVALQCCVSFTIQQSESATCMHISSLFWISFPFRSPQSTKWEFPVLCSKVSLVIYFIHSVNRVYMSIPRVSQVVLVQKNLPANAGRDMS